MTPKVDPSPVEAPEGALLAALADAMGGQVLTRHEAAARLEVHGERFVIVLDPYETMRLLEPWLREMLEPREEAASILDVARRQLVVEGQRIDLTRLEFAFIEYLYQRRGKVVGRASLMCDVWGFEYTGGSM